MFINYSRVAEISESKFILSYQKLYEYIFKALQFFLSFWQKQCVLSNIRAKYPTVYSTVDLIRGRKIERE